MIERLLVIGAGAIGTYIGANLARTGKQVVVLEREQDITELQKKGLTLEQNGEKFNVRDVDFIRDLSTLQRQNIDVIIVALKTYHLDGLITDLQNQTGQLPPLLSLQNGVDSQRRLESALGPNIVIPGTVTSAVDRIQKGHAAVSKLRGTGIAGPHPLVKDLMEAFRQAELHPRYYPQAPRMKWSKLLTNLLGNASSAILDLPISTIYAHPELYRMELDQIKETLQVMDRQGISAVNLPGIPVRLMAGIAKYLPPGLSKLILSRAVGGGRGEKMPSFHIDLHSGKGVSEVNELNGAVVRKGEQFGCHTPVNSFLFRTLTALLHGDLPLNRYQGNPRLFLDDLNHFKETFLVNE